MKFGLLQAVKFERNKQMSTKKAPIDNAIKYAFANHLRAYRDENGLTQTDLAEIVHVPREVVSAYENARRQITMTTLLKWSRFLHISPIVLVPTLSEN